MIFQKGNIARISGEDYEALVVDEDFAVLGKITNNVISFENTLIFSNVDNYKDVITGLEEIR